MNNEIREQLIEYYYRFTWGSYTKEDKAVTAKTVDYLIDNGFDAKEIAEIMRNSDLHQTLTPQKLPCYIWESLIKRDVFYYHNTLHITSKPPTWNPVTLKEECEPFFMEMKISYTITDLLDYYYTKCNIDIELRNENRDKASFEYLLNNYKFKELNIEPLDVVLLLIDTASRNNFRLTNPLKLQDLELEVLDYIKVMLPEAEHAGANKIVWR